MEMQDAHPSKRFRLQNGGAGAGRGITKAGGRATAASPRHKECHQDDEDDDGEVRSRLGKGSDAEAAALGVRPWQWHQQQHSTASRICRVSRASGGKDRHSKVLTSKGLRDRRVRLSVPTAIQFYDLQDRLGYDQPSKAVEWLINAAATAIADLPYLDAAFPDHPLKPGDEEGDPPRTSEDQEDTEVAQPEHPNQQQEQQRQHVSVTKSACSSTSETSKGSVLSLSRSEIRVKARERARERTATAKEKKRDKDGEEDAQFASVEQHQGLNLNPSSQSSFIELLTCGGQHNQNHNHGPVITAAQASPIPNFIPKQHQQQLRHSAPISPAIVKADFFGQVGLFGEGEKPHQPPSFPSQTHFNVSAAAAPAIRNHPEMQHYQQQQQFSFMPEHLIPMAATAAGGDYINFSISSGVAGFNRGTLQSNFASPQHNHQLQRLSSAVDGSNLPFFLSATAQAAPPSWEGTFPAGFDSRLQLFYDGYRHSDLKGKGKS